MKYTLFRALLVLFLVLSCTPLTESTEYCTRQEVDFDVCRILLPVGFEPDGSKDHFSVPNERKTLAFYDPTYSWNQPAYYESTAECEALLVPYARNNAYEFVRVDECNGILFSESYGDEIWATWLYVTNRKQIFSFSTAAESPEESLAIMNEVLAHIVAPEQPLK